MKNSFLEYIKIYNEVIDPKSYRDTQIAKTVDGLKNIENYEIDKVTFLGDFLEKIINVIKTFPYDKDLANRSASSSMKPPEDRFRTLEKRMQLTSKGRSEDEDDDENDNNDDDDEYDGEGFYDDDYNNDDEDEEEEYDEAYNPYTDKALEHDFLSLNISDTNFFDNTLLLIEEIKDGNFNNNEIVKRISNKNFKKLLSDKNYNDNFYKYLYCGILNYLSKNNYFERLVLEKGKKYIWIRSNIKDIIFTPVSREFLSEINKKNIQISTLKTLVPDYEQMTSKDIIKKLNSLNKENKENIKEITDALDKNGKAFYNTKQLTVSESRAAVLNLFKRLRMRFQNDSKLKKTITPIGLRKLIFDYNTIKPATLTNEFLIDIKKAKEILLKLNYQFNDFEFEMGRVNKNSNLYTFKELVPILKQETSEIKTFTPQKETERQKIIEELNLKTESFSHSFDKQLEEKLINLETDQAKELKNILSYDEKVNKKLADLIKEGMSIKKNETNEILKKYNRTKFNRLLALTKEKNEIEGKENKVGKEEYEQLISILSNPIISTTEQKLKIIFTLSPRTFISQSTRANMANNIKSCMNIFYGSNRRFIPTSLMDGAFSAWLVKVNKNNKGEDIIDSKIIDPIGRVIIKPFRDQNNNIIWMPDKSYVSDDRYQNLNDKIFDIIKYQLDDNPEGVYTLNKNANYRDTVSEIKNNTFTKTINDKDQLEKVMQAIPENLRREFVDVALSSSSPEFFIDKLNDIKLNKELKIRRLYLFSPTTTKEINNDFKIEDLAVGSENIKRIGDNVKIKKLSVNYNSELKNINNLKHLKEIKKLNIDNTDFVFPDKLDSSENLRELSLNNATFKNMKEINFPNANVRIFDSRNLPEKITANELTISNSNISNVKQIKTNMLSIRKSVDQKGAKEISEFIKLYEKLYENPKAVMVFINIINKINSNSDNVNNDVSGVYMYKENMQTFISALETKFPLTTFKKLYGKVTTFKNLFLKQYQSLSKEERENIKKILFHPFLFYFINMGGKIKIIENNFKFKTEKREKQNNLNDDDEDFDPYTDDEDTDFSYLENLLTATSVAAAFDDKKIEEAVKSDEKKNFFNYLKNYKLNIINESLYNDCEEIELYITYYKELDLRKNKKLKKINIYENFDLKVYLPEQIENISLNDLKLETIANLNQLTNLKQLSFAPGDEEPNISEELLTRIVNLDLIGKHKFFLKYLHNRRIYEMVTESLEERNMNTLTDYFDIKENKQVLKENILKYIKEEKLEEKFAKLNLKVLTRLHELDNISLKNLIPKINEKSFSVLNINFDEKTKEIQNLKDKTIYLEFEKGQRDLKIFIKNKNDNFYCFNFDMVMDFIYLNKKDFTYLSKEQKKIYIDIDDGSNAIIDVNKLTEKLKNIKQINIIVNIMTRNTNRKVLCDHYYKLSQKNNGKIESLYPRQLTIINAYDMPTINLTMRDIESDKLDLDKYFKTKNIIEVIHIVINIDDLILEIKNKYFKTINNKKMTEEIEKTIKIKIDNLFKNFEITYKELNKTIQDIIIKIDDTTADLKNNIEKIIYKQIFLNITNESYDSLTIEDMSKEIEKLVID